MKYLTIGYDYTSYYGNANYEAKESISFDMIALLMNKSVEEIESKEDKLLNYLVQFEINLGEIEGKHSDVDTDLEVEINDYFESYDSADLDRLQEFLIEKLYDFFDDTDEDYDCSDKLKELGYDDIYDYFNKESNKQQELTLNINKKIVFKSEETKSAFEKEFEMLKRKYEK